LELPPPQTILAIAIVIFFAIGLHEYAHAKFADVAGDPTPRYYGRVTLNLTKHFDPIGTLMIIFTSLTGFGIGWGKPVPMDPRKMRNPRWDHFAAVAAGPISNILQATVYALILRLLLRSDSELLQAGSGFIGQLLLYGVMINLALCFFNLIPLGPLDGHWLAGSFMPEPVQIRWYMFNRTYGTFLLLGLVLLGQMGQGRSLLSMIIGPPINATFRFLTGIPMPIY
jgi:Zn-dependent protease